MCTSLGLGAMQLNAGLNYMSTTWGTGVQIADNSDSHVVIVLGITLIATTSVVTGLRQGLKHLSILAMVLCLIVLLTVTLADNTWYLANVFTQAIGYYAQHIIGTAFDCEAFQQLGYEFRSSNLLWGSDDGKAAALVQSVGALSGAGAMATADCGAQPNPCTEGTLLLALANAKDGASRLAAVGLSAADAALAGKLAAAAIAAYGGSLPPISLPCGAANTTHDADGAPLPT